MRFLRRTHHVVNILITALTLPLTTFLWVAGSVAGETIDHNWECKWGDCVDGFGSVVTVRDGYEFIGTRKNRKAEGYMITITPSGEVCESLHVNNVLVGVRACQVKTNFCVWEYERNRPSGDFMCVNLAGESEMSGVYINGALRKQTVDALNLNAQLSDMRSHETAQLRESFLPDTYRANLLLPITPSR